jgi:ribosomal protein S18 acetylase RimI-like enzyme
MKTGSGQVKIDERTTVSFRPARAEDEPFLFELYKSTRSEELAGYGWPTEQQEMFLKLQFDGQQQHYKMAGAGCEHHIILLEDVQAGRLLVIRTDKEIRLADISLLPEHRNRRLGSRIVEALQREAAEAGQALTLHVAKTNRAARLYERLGFKTAADAGLHFYMEWRGSEEDGEPDL